jgi:hypothetical protein
MTAGVRAAAVPQTGVARMIRDVVRAEGTLIAATAVIEPTHPLVAGGVAPAYLGIEIGAQAAAALAASTAGAGEPGRAIGGRLALDDAGDEVVLLAPDGSLADAVAFGAGDYTALGLIGPLFAQPSLPTGVVLDVTAECTGAFAPLATYRVEVRQAGAVAVAATISTYTLGPVSS